MHNRPLSHVLIDTRLDHIVRCLHVIYYRHTLDATHTSNCLCKICGLTSTSTCFACPNSVVPTSVRKAISTSKFICAVSLLMNLAESSAFPKWVKGYRLMATQVTISSRLKSLVRGNVMYTLTFVC